MRNFWLRLWSYWFLYSNFIALLVGAIIYVLAYLLLYIKSQNAVGEAIHTLSFFSAKVGWAAGYIISLLLVIKRLFGRELNGYRLVMYDCKIEERFEEVYISDTLRLWRKWLVRLAWALIAVVLLIMSLHFVGINGLVKFVNIYTIWAFVSFVGGWILIVLISKCPRIKVIKRNNI